MSQKSTFFPVKAFKIWCNSLFKDHAILRIFWTNLSPVVPHQIWRANHPTPYRFKKLTKKLGLKSAINLRGNRPTCGSDLLGRKTCLHLELPYEDMAFESRNFPQKDRILRFYTLWETLPKPMLIHCKSGADRAGIASALILLFEGKKVSEAKKQLHWRFLHFRHSRTGVLDQFLELYQTTGEVKNIPFLEWIKNHYEDEKLREIIQRSRACKNKAQSQPNKKK
ncbi:protein tyrosine phosphatase [Acetobacteraceae bacterium]|nr:protein tyrosine phosphatase [Acetobacteraceae bacterium]